jgi:hypothetical protein
MAKFVIDLSAVTAAAAADADAMSAFEDMHMAMLTWHMAAAYPTTSDLTKALAAGYASNPRVVATKDTLAQYASGILKWAKAGKVPKAHSMRAFMGSVPGAKGKGGRPAKAKANPAGEGEKATLPNDDKAWVQFIEGVRAQVPGRKDWAADDIVAMQECAAKMIALVKRNAK